MPGLNKYQEKQVHKEKWQTYFLWIEINLSNIWSHQSAFKWQALQHNSLIEFSYKIRERISPNTGKILPKKPKLYSSSITPCFLVVGDVQINSQLQDRWRFSNGRYVNSTKSITKPKHPKT